MICDICAGAIFRVPLGLLVRVFLLLRSPQERIGVANSQITSAADTYHASDMPLPWVLEWQRQFEALERHSRTPVPVADIPRRSEGSSLG
jgi:hypothetical protein